MTAARTLPIALAAALLSAGAAHAQPVAGPPEKVKQVIVYGEDACPPSDGDEITVCARMPEKERFRIPPALRDDPNDPKLQSWLNRAQSIEYVGKSGTDSCSPVGAGGFTGCFAQIARQAKQERKTMLGNSSWADLVAAERAKRLSVIDADSEKIEAQAKAEEAAQAKQAQTPAK